MSVDGQARTVGDDVLQQQVTALLEDILERRVVIEQAKGMLMLVYGLTAERAFELLKWRSQTSNVKLRVLAEQLVADFATISRGSIDAHQFDHALIRNFEHYEGGSTG